MLRRRVPTRADPLALVGRLLVLLVAAGLVWYGLMVVLLAVKVAPSSVDAISGYRTAYDALAGLRPDDVTPGVRAIVAAAGIAAFLGFGFLARRELPSPRFARPQVALEAGERGETVVSPRAVERMAEGAALSHPEVTRAAGVYGAGELAVEVTVEGAREVADTLQAVHAGVTAALLEHELPTVPVRVTLTGFDRPHKRELH